MPSRESNPIWYVYGVVPGETAGAMPAGIDDAPVTIEREGQVAALVSTLDQSMYAPALIEANSGDVDWLSPRAVAHDRVLTWASDHGPVVPMPMFSVFSGQGAVCDMLRERAAQLDAALTRVARGREYALRVFRVDDELMSAAPELSPRLRELAASAAAAAPGQRYLLERKLDGERKTEMRALTREIVDEIATTLNGHALDAVRSPIPRTDDGATGAATRGTMVLNAAFLVAPATLHEFQKTLTSLIERHTAHGFRFDFTGPWPPYHFVNEPTRDG